MMNQSRTKLVVILIQAIWLVVTLSGLVFLLIGVRLSEVPIENAIHFTTGMTPSVFLAVFGWLLVLVGLVTGSWWYYEFFLIHTLYVRTPYGELEIHKAALQSYLEQQLSLLSEVVSCDVYVSVVKRKFVNLDVRVKLSHEKSCREYAEKLQQEILQMLLSTFGVKDIRRFHLQVNAFFGGETKKAVTYR
ncbi:Asp23/Gls24 family envelope stress response protein [Thermospira aquatica]|uniref:Alkaline shock response membrane anchor protein AmaP n=1 Tax=Thermospira aquatica TaxID=2828656 RepID=A0AAX3BE65_9SPIR|nr:hypothetical protein [Thermospira aquatica]URA10036.1 hypothetical protein KDW03_11220 [Thermospira aquatica]